MKQSTVQARIRQNPKFAELVSKRTRVAVRLSLAALVPYYAFMMVTAFKPELLAQLISSSGSSITIGWPIILFLVAERLRSLSNLGKFTFADIASYRLDQNRIRTFAAFGSLTVTHHL